MIWVGALDNPGVLAFCTFDIASTSPCLTKANKNKIPHSSHQHSSALFAVEKPKNKKVKQSADAHLEERIDDNDLNSAAAALQDRESSSYSLGLTPYLYPTKGKRKRLRSRLRPRLRFFSPFRSDSKKNEPHYEEATQTIQPQTTDEEKMEVESSDLTVNEEKIQDEDRSHDPGETPIHGQSVQNTLHFVPAGSSNETNPLDQGLDSFIWTAPSSSSNQSQDQQNFWDWLNSSVNTTSANGTSISPPLILPVPFTQQFNRSSPPSIAENLLQLAPKVVNETMGLWTNPNASSSFLWDTAAESAAAWNNASLWNATYYNVYYNGEKVAANVSGLAESILKSWLEQAEFAENEFKNLTRRTLAPPTFMNPSIPNPAATKNVNASKTIGKSAKIPKQPTWGTIPLVAPKTFVQQQQQQSSLARNPNDPLTLQDLERVLQEYGYTRQENRKEESQAAVNDKRARFASVGKPVSSQQFAIQSSSSKKPEKVGEVAFPQPSVLSYNNVKWGTAVASGFFFMIFASALVPNLWLVGMIAGGFYGYDTGKEVPQVVPKAVIPSMLVRAGTRIAKVSLQAYDFCVGLLFMYKTGVLSYEYWKKYALLDQKFKIQDKVDAWNARFIEGKENFDKWERENEIGRKVLATLRTAWLVEERSLKKGLRRRRKQSRYRVVQLIYDVAYSSGKLIGSLLKLLTGGGSTELTEFLKGIRIDISQAKVEGIGARVGAVLAAIFALNILSSLFTISPVFTSVMAIIISLVWPTWTSELVERLARFFDDTRRVGRGEDSPPTVARVRSRSERERYHFFITNDGKKRYYRTAQPFWPWQKKKEVEKKGILKFLNG